MSSISKQRVVVCDQDPSINATLGHLLGVAFNTPALFGGRVAPVRVEILGEFKIDSPLMASVQGERFSARPFSRSLFARRATSVVTFSGVPTDDIIRRTIGQLSVPVVCLSELRMIDVTAERSLQRIACSLDHGCNECVSREFSAGIDSARLADLCRDFATMVAGALD